jgi:hypothetical protein
VASAELYLYWRVRPGAFDAACAALRSWQAGLLARHPTLSTRVLQRSDERGITLMEIYAATGGLGDALRAEIIDGGATVVAPHAAGERKVETFDPLWG